MRLCYEPGRGCDEGGQDAYFIAERYRINGTKPRGDCCGIRLLIRAALADQINLKLGGAAEVPPVATKAEGTGKIVVGKDGSVTGTITTKDVEGTAAHIHTGAAGKNGPPIITLEKSSPSTWTVPAGAKLNESQLASYKAGELYVNVHSAAHQAGEIRAQLVSK